MLYVISWLMWPWEKQYKQSCWLNKQRRFSYGYKNRGFYSIYKVTLVTLIQQCLTLYLFDFWNVTLADDISPNMYRLLIFESNL